MNNYTLKIQQTEEQKKDVVCSAIVGELLRQLENLQAIPKIQEELTEKINKLIEGLKKFDILVSIEQEEKTETSGYVSQVENKPIE